MALNDWTIVETGTPSRRTRHTKLHIILSRVADDLQVRLGNSIRFNNDDTPRLGIIGDIDVSEDNIQITVFLYTSTKELYDRGEFIEEIDSNSTETELVLTSSLVKTSILNITDRIEVHKSSGHGFYCNRKLHSKISPLNLDKVVRLLTKDVKGMDRVRALLNETFKANRVTNANPFLSDGSNSTITGNDLDTTLDQDASADSENDQDDEEIVVEIDDNDEYNKPKRPRGRPRKYPNAPVLPKRPRGRPRKHPLKSNAFHSPNKDTSGTSWSIPLGTPNRKHIKTKDNSEADSLKFIQRLIGNKVVMSKLPTPNFNLTSPQSKRKQREGDYQLLDTYSQAFKDLKQKLHTATKLQSLPCREDEFTSLYLHIENAILHQLGCCLYVSGTPGVGKTATIREVMTQLKEQQESGDLNEFDYVELNALKLISPTDAYEVLWNFISGLSIAPSHAAMFLDTYFKNPSELKKPMVVMVDELDQFATARQNVMYNLFNWPSYPESKLIVIAVANTMDLPERMLSNKISSRLGLKRLQFIGYSFEQLSGIIEHRLELLKLTNNKVNITKDAINFASRKVASVSGDARRALQIVRRAVEIAELDYMLNSSKDNDAKDNDTTDTFEVKIGHISKAINETLNSPIAVYVSTLSYTSKLVLVAIILCMKRTGLNENPLGDIIDQIQQLLVLSQPPSIESKYGLVEIHVNVSNLRIDDFRFIVLELAENGIINIQTIKTERYKMVSLNVSKEEVTMSLQNDADISRLL